MSRRQIHQFLSAQPHWCPAHVLCSTCSWICHNTTQTRRVNSWAVYNAHRHPCGSWLCHYLFLGRMWAKPAAVASCPSAGYPPPCCVSPGMFVFLSLVLWSSCSGMSPPHTHTGVSVLLPCHAPQKHTTSPSLAIPVCLEPQELP